MSFLGFWKGTRQTIFDSIIKTWKYRSEQLWTVIDFLSLLKTFKKKTSFIWNSQPPERTGRGCFSKSILRSLWCYLLTKNILMPLVKVYVRERGNDATVLWNWPWRKLKLSRHIKLNETNIALLLQEAAQKYCRLTDYWTKSCYLFSLSRFLHRPSSRVFPVL